MQRDSQPALRGSAWAFDRVAGTYRRARPEYPAAVAGHVAAELGLDGRSAVVEVGAGTGKCTLALLAAGLRPLALEPLGRMLGELRAELPEVPAARSVAERLPLANGSVDAVVAAAAFHWFHRERAAAEFRRVLRPGGGLALLWQARVEAAWPWDALGPVLDRHRGDHPGTREIVAAVRTLPGFAPFDRQIFPHAERRSPSEVVDRVLSLSYVAALPDGERQAVADDVAAIVAGRDEVTLAYEVIVLTSRRR